MSDSDLEHDTNERTHSKSEDQKQWKHTLGRLIGWVLGVFLLIGGFGGLFTEPLSGAIILLIGFLIFPPIVNFTNSKLRLRLAGGLKAVLIVVLLIILGAVTPEGENSSSESSQPKPTKAISEKHTIANDPLIKQAQDKERLAKSSQLKPTKIIYHKAQISFHLLNKPFLSRYDRAVNEIKKSTIYNEACSLRKSYLKNSSFQFTDWIGKIITISTDQGGDVAYIKLVSKAGEFKMVYQTWNNRLSDVFDNTMLKRDSKVYNQVANLQEGDFVKFSGKFLSDEEKGVKEMSISERGCLRYPEFIIKFSNIVKY